MTSGVQPRTILGLLSDETRLRVVAAVALGRTTVAEVADLAGLSHPEVEKALERLVGAGVLEVVPVDRAVSGRATRDGSDAAGLPAPESPVERRSLRIVPGLFAEATRTVALLHGAPSLEERGATPGQAAVLRNFLDDSGRLRQIPVARSKRLAVLDFVAQRFEPGRVYPERDVNMEIGKLHRDTAALRRYLVDEGFLERRDGFYWRAGGTYDPTW